MNPRTDAQTVAHPTKVVARGVKVFYGQAEAQEGRDAYRQKRAPDFSRFPKRA